MSNFPKAQKILIAKYPNDLKHFHSNEFGVFSSLILRRQLRCYTNLWHTVCWDGKIQVNHLNNPEFLHKRCMKWWETSQQGDVLEWLPRQWSNFVGYDKHHRFYTGKHFSMPVDWDNQIYYQTVWLSHYWSTLGATVSISITFTSTLLTH